MVIGWLFDGRGGFRREESAVSEVLGTVLLVAVTVVMAAGFALLLGTFGGPTDRAHTDLDIRLSEGDDGVWGTDDEAVIVRHMGGEALDARSTELIIRIGGSPEVRFSGESLPGFDDGSFDIGESLVMPFTINAGTTVDVLMISGEGGSSVIGANSINPGGVTVPGGIVYTYPTGESTPAHGTVIDFDNVKAADDATATYTEGFVSTTGTETRTASTATSTGGTTSPDNARTSNNAYAVLVGSGDSVRVNGWGSAPGTTVTKVTAFLDAHFETTGSGGQTTDVIRFKYLDNGGVVSSQDYSPTATDSTQSVVLAAPGGAWDAAEIDNLALEAEYIAINPEDKRDFHIDAMWIEIETSGDVYSLESNFVFSSVPDGNQWLVEARYKAEADAFRIEVQSAGGGWVGCGSNLNSAALINWQGCGLSSGQYNAGSPTLRVVDVTGSATAQGVIEFDYVRIRTT